jgi:hypothetical protein
MGERGRAKCGDRNCVVLQHQHHLRCPDRAAESRQFDNTAAGHQHELWRVRILSGGRGERRVLLRYQQAAAEGISVFVSAGDEGAASCDAGLGFLIRASRSADLHRRLTMLPLEARILVTPI